MNIIFGDSVKLLGDKYTVLELDTFFVTESQQTITTYCVVEKIPLQELPTAERWSRAHHDMLREYRAKNWNFVLNALEELRGRWAGEVDSFYDIMKQRCNEYQLNDPGPEWTGLVYR